MKNSSAASFSFAQPLGQKIVLALLVIFTYVNMPGNGYNIDDNLVTQKHPLTSKGLSAIKEIFTSSYYSNQAEIRFGYRPLTHVSFAVEHQFFGEKPMVSHAINLILYILCVILFYNLISQWVSTAEHGLAFCAAALFAVHPVHSEVVNSIKNRDELLAFLFMAASLLHAGNFLKSRSLISWIMVSVLFALGMLSKKSIYPMVLAFPLVSVFVLRADIRTSAIALAGLLIPAALIGSGLDKSRLIMMVIIPPVILLIAYAITRINLLATYVKQVIHTAAFTAANLACIASIILMAYRHQQVAYVIAALPFAFLALKGKPLFTVPLLLLSLLFTGVLFTNSTLVITALCISAGYTLYNWRDAKKIRVALVINVLALGAFVFVNHPGIGSATILGMAGIFLFLMSRKISWAFLFSVVLVIISALLFETQFYMIAFLVYAGLMWLRQTQTRLKPEYILVLLVGAALIYVSYKNQSLQQVYEINFTHSKVEAVVAAQAIQESGRFNEGRSLHYIENTLVIPHSTTALIFTGFSVLGEYIRLMIFPAELSFYYGYAKLETTSFSNPFAWISILIHAALIVLAAAQLKKRPLLSIGIAWYLFGILLFSNWVELVAGMVGERLAFTASAGFCLLAASLIIWLKPQFDIGKPKATEYVFIAILLLMGARTIARNASWSDALTLMQHDIEHLDRSAYAHHTLALNLMHVSSVNTRLNQQEAADMQVQAIQHLKRSIEIYPYFFNAHFDLARVYLGHSDYRNAGPALLDAHKLDSTNLFVLEELAKVSFELKDVEQTERYANLFLTKEPLNENVHEILAYIMITSGHKEKAKTYAERGLMYFPQNRNLQMMLRDSQK